MSRIVNLRTENIKKLVAVDITPTENMVLITGPNGAGKTSVLDSIWWALAGAHSHQARPIREGQKKATIRLDLGEVIVIREFERRKVVDGDENETEEITTRVKVESSAGARFPSPQRMLDSLMGSLSFDPLAFARRPPKDQHKMLSDLLGLDFSTQEGQIRRDFDLRSDWNRKVRDDTAAAESITYPNDTPDEMISVQEILDELAAVEKRNRESEGEERRREGIRRSCQQDQSSVREKRGLAAQKIEQANALMEEARALDNAAEELEGSINLRLQGLKDMDAVPPPEDTSPFRTRIAESQGINRNVEAKKKQVKLLDSARVAKDKAAKCTETIEKRREEIRKMISEADMPVPGLGLSEGVVTFDGLPLDQASDADQLRVSCAIAMRSDQDLKVIRIRDGSLLDDKSLGVLAEMAREHDYQVWMERVDSSGTVGFVIEEGRLKNTAATETDLQGSDPHEQ